MRRKVVAGMLTFAMFGMSLSSFSPTQVCAADDLGKVEVHVSAKEGGYDQTLPDLQFEKADAAQSSGYVKVYPDEKRQTFLGVGGAMTESAAYNLQKLSKEQQEEVYEAYFGESGAKYSVLRSTIGSADFSTRSYSYNDTEEPDPDLKNFSIEKDWDYIIPAIQKAQSYRPDIKFFAAPWAPPAWMKNSGVRRGQTGTAGLNFVDNSVKPEYYKSYANYLVKYIQEYEKVGIDVYSLSMQNEAQNNPKWEAATWSTDAVIDFVGNYLGPALEENQLDPQLLIWDWDKGNDPMHHDGFIDFNTKVLSDANARKYIDGIAFHWYAGDLWHEMQGVPMWSEDFYSLDEVKAKFPDIHLYATEGCQEKGPWFGSYDPADRYIYDILNDFEHGTEGWIDWNLVLDRDGGPTQGVVNQCHAPIMLDENNNVCYQPSYYILKQISRTVQPGTVSIKSATDMDIAKTAVLDEEGMISVMLGNVTDEEKTVTVVDADRSVDVTLKPHSLTTVKYDSNYQPDDSIDSSLPDVLVKPIAAEASSYEKNPIYNYQAESAIDDSMRTRWASDWTNQEYITFELSSRATVSGIELKFENGYDALYDIQVSDDGKNFKTVKTVMIEEMNAPEVTVKFDPVKARYVRFQGIQRNNRYGYSICDTNILVKQ